MVKKRKLKKKIVTKLKLQQNSKTQIVTKLEISNCDKTKKNQIVKNSPKKL